VVVIKMKKLSTVESIQNDRAKTAAISNDTRKREYRNIPPNYIKHLEPLRKAEIQVRTKHVIDLVDKA
jgi:hypothetical protein